MKHHQKRVVCFLLGVCLILSMVSGCQQDPPAVTQGATDPTVTTTVPQQTEQTQPVETTLPVETTAPTEYIGLSMDQNEKEVITTYLESFTLSGTSDPSQPVLVNGEAAVQDENGYFTYTATLAPGENTLTVTHKEESVSYTVNRQYCVQFYSPDEARAYGSGATVFLEIAVREGSELKATFCGEEVTMKESKDQLGTGVAEGFLIYKGQYYLPSGNEEDVSMGDVVFTVTCDGITETYSSGELTCNAAVEIKFNDKEATPEGYRNVGSGYIVEVVDQSVETFNGYGNDDYSNPTYNYLPEGTLDYGYYNTVYSNSGEQSYKLLRCGVRVYEKVKNTPITAQSAAVDCYTGYLPDYNEIEVDSIEVKEHHTYLTLNTMWKAPFFFDFEEQDYRDASTRNYTVERFDATYVDITFCYATEVGGSIEIPAENPLFSRAEWIQNTSDYTLRLYLKVEGGLYGWDAFYNEEGQLVFQFLNPVLVTTTTENTYGVDLTGTRIMIDVGHGKGDTGAFNVDNRGLGWIESERNLALALELKAELESMGATVILNRTSQEEMLTQRERILFLKQESPDYCIAIHHNAAVTQDRSGFEAGYFTIFSQLATDHIHYATDDAGIYGSSYVMWYFYYVNRQTNCPSVLTECGYMTNPTDFTECIDSEIVHQKAVAMAQGVANYFLEVTEMNS